jgi:hypothetical protein
MRKTHEKNSMSISHPNLNFMRTILRNSVAWTQVEAGQLNDIFLEIVLIFLSFCPTLQIANPT